MFSLFRSCCCLRSSQVSVFARRYASAPKPLNQAIVEMLRKHREEEEASPNRNGYKVRAFDNAIKLLNKLDHRLRSADEAMTLKGVGPGITRRISEFLAQNHNMNDPLDGKTDTCKDIARRILKTQLEAIPGVGSVKAQKLIDAGVTKVADLRKVEYSAMLSHAQKIGFQYLEHLDKPASREEAESVVEFIRTNISSKYEVIIVGSYRRGAPTSSDIDIIILHPNHVHVPVPDIPSPQFSLQPRVINKTLRTSYVSATEKASSHLHNDVVPTLEDRGLLAAHLTKGSRKWQGIVRIPEKDEQGMWGSRHERLEAIGSGMGAFRRLDLNLVPVKSRGAAMISLTGDLELNRHLRMKAVKLGMHLNEFGLWKWVSNNFPSIEKEETDAHAEEAAATSEATEPSGFWQLMRATTEEEIFERLGMDFIEPQRRNFAFVDKPATSVQKKGMGKSTS